MIIFLNKSAAGGRAEARWRQVQQQLPFTCTVTESLSDIKMLYQQGARHFVAAGGDGTVNILATYLIHTFSERELQEIQLGAIGIGSSNDYHKGLPAGQHIAGFACRIDPRRAERRDVLAIETESGTHYALLNIGIGFTAHANAIFNQKRGIISKVKRYSTTLAIALAIGKTLLRYAPEKCTITCEDASFETRLYNLNILKSPHVASGLCYPCPFVANSGTAAAHLIHNCSIWSFIHKFILLARKNLSDPLEYLTTIRAISEQLFRIEFDGEVCLAKNASITVKKNLLNCC